MPRRPLCLLLLLAASAQAENASEDAFRSAIDWTVQVRTSVSQPFAEDEQGTWFGAGLLVDAGRGWVLTNAHVAGRSYGKVSIAFQDGRNVPARRVYVDPYLDLAVLAFDPRRLPAKTSVPVLDCGPRRPSVTLSARSATPGASATPARAASPRPSPLGSAPPCCRPTRPSTKATPAAR